MKNKYKYNLLDLAKLLQRLDNGTFIIDSDDGVELFTSNEGSYTEDMRRLLWWLEQDEPILDEVEKEYLSGIIKPWKEKVKFIAKYTTYDGNHEFININYLDTNISLENVSLPSFKPNTMYRGMELDKEYTLKELGL